MWPFKRKKKLKEASIETQVLSWISSLMGTGEREIPAMTRETMEAQAYQGFQTNPSIFNFVNTMSSFMFGSGVQLSHPDETVEELLEDFKKSNKFDRKAVELANGYYIIGVRFPVLYTNTLTGECKLREFDPSTIVNIVTDPEDYEEITGLRREWTVKNWNEDGTSYTSKTEKEFTRQGDATGPFTVRYFFVWKRPTVAGETRGWTFLAPVLHYTTQLREFIKMRLNVQRALASFAWIWNLKNLEGTSADKQAQVTAFREALAAQDPPAPGSRLVTHDDAEIRAETSGVSAGQAGAEGDYRALGLRIATGLSLPEFIATGDASNANYASTSIALRAVVKYFEKEQTIWLGDGYFGELFERVLQTWYEAGLITEEAASVPITITPPVITQESLNELKGILDSMYDKKIIDGEAYAALTPFDIDYAQIQQRIEQAAKEERIKKEKESPPPPPIPPAMPVEVAGVDTGEEDAVL